MEKFTKIDQKYDLILPIRMFDNGQKRKLDDLFHQYCTAVRDTAVSFAVARMYWWNAPCTYAMILEYLHDNYPRLGSAKVYRSAASRAIQAQYQIIQSVKPYLDKHRRFSRRLVEQMKIPDDLRSTSSYRYIPFEITDLYSSKLHLPFRCSLQHRTISVINDQVWSVPSFTSKLLMEHAESLPDGMSPKVLNICRVQEDERCRYEVRISFGEDSTDSKVLKRTYKGTVRMLYQQSMKTTRKGAKHGKRI